MARGDGIFHPHFSAGLRDHSYPPAKETGEAYDLGAQAFVAPAVRDLAWLMCSPALLSRTVFGAQMADPFDVACFGAEPRARMQALMHWLDKDPDALTEALTVTGERRLGRYAERLLAAWLQYVPGIDVTAISLPVREAGRTLGECDALFRTASGCFEHWELAVKFYLFVDDPCATHTSIAAVDRRFDGCDAYVGAGLADRFDWKLRRLIDHQLPLSGHPELTALAPMPWQARMFVKGRLFYPLEHWQEANGGVATPAALASDHPRGWWATWDTWKAWSATADCAWTGLARLDWLAPLRVESSRARTAAAFEAELATHFAAGMPSAGVSRQVAALSLSADGKGAHELSRGFIVPNEWPERALRFRRSGV